MESNKSKLVNCEESGPWRLLGKMFSCQSLALAGPSITTHTFEDILMNSPVTFHIMKLHRNSLFVYVGDSGTLGNLSVAMTTPYAQKPTASNLLGHSTDDLSSSLAEKLSQRTGKQVFASCNVSKVDNCVIVALVQRLLIEAEKYPDMW